MNVSMNATDCGQISACLTFGRFSWLFLLWDIADTLLVVLTNGITMFIMISNSLLDTSSNIFIACLTLGDMISAAALPFRITAEYIVPGTVWKISCFLNVLISNVSSMTNVITLLVIGVDRLVYFVYALEYNTLLPVQKATKIVYAIWGSAIVYIAAVLGFGYQYYRVADEGTKMCSAYYSMHVVSKAVYIICYCILILATIGIYIKIGLVAWKQKHSIAAAAENGAASPPAPDYKITRVMLNVLVIYMICNIEIVLLPVAFNNLPEHLRPMAVRIGSYIWRVNRWVNPFIYARKSAKFRKYVKKLFNPDSPSNNQPSELF